MSQATSTSVVTDRALRSRLLTGAAGQVCALGLLGLWLHAGGTAGSTAAFSAWLLAPVLLLAASSALGWWARRHRSAVAAGVAVGAVSGGVHALTLALLVMAAVLAPVVLVAAFVFEQVG